MKVLSESYDLAHIVSDLTSFAPECELTGDLLEDYESLIKWLSDRAPPGTALSLHFWDGEENGGSLHAYINVSQLTELPTDAKS